MSDELIPDPAAEMLGEVAEHLRGGHTGRAQAAFSRGWRDAVPELPLRFSVILVRPDREVVAEVDKLVREGTEVKMQLERIDESLVQVVLADAQRVGNLPAEDARLLQDLGADADLYSPLVLEIRYNEKGRLDYIAVELVRPEVRYCSACSRQHSGPHVNCEECRAKRRPKGEG